MTKEEILEECKRRYPPGVDYYCLHNCNQNVSNGIFIIDADDDCVRTNGGGKCCYAMGTFAEVKSKVINNYQLY